MKMRIRMLAALLAAEPESIGVLPQPFVTAACIQNEKLGILLSQIDDDTLVMVTADHGNDPTYTGTDHTREDVPLICYYNGINGGVMPTMESFTVISSTILENFGLKMSKSLVGTPILEIF